MGLYLGLSCAKNLPDTGLSHIRSGVEVGAGVVEVVHVIEGTLVG